MTVGFKRPIEVTFFVPTASGSLVEVGSGNSAALNVAIDKFEGDGTGYSNPFTEYTVPARLDPRVAKQFDLQAMGYRFLGDCSIKVDTKYEGLVASGSHVKIGTVEWSYKRIAELGTGLANDRIVLALTRK